MNIKQALKKKNLLVEQIKQEFVRATTYNSIEVGNTRAYSAIKSMENYLKLTDELIELKTSIHKTNEPVYDKIFKLSEYKSIIKYLKSLNCVEGKFSGNRWGGESSEPRIMEVEIGIVERDNMISKYESLINDIQDELDYFNQITELYEENTNYKYIDFSDLNNTGDDLDINLEDNILDTPF